MWNKSFLIRCKGIWQNHSYRRFAIALGISFLLHLFLIDKFYFNVPALNQGHHLVEAQLVLDTPILSKPVLPVPMVVPVKSEPVKPDPIVEDVTEPVLPEAETPISSESQASVEPSPSALAAKTVSQIKPSDAEPPPESITEEPVIKINPDVYQYVETEFDVRTDISASVSSRATGKAKIVYELLPNREQYKIKSLMEAKGLAGLVIPDLLQTSDGFLINTGLQPKHYLYQFGNNKNKTFTADFDWEQKKLYLHGAKGDQTLDLVEENGNTTQDLLSFMYQFMLSPPLQTLKFNITNGKKLGLYEYSFEGEEVTPTKMGNLTTVHLLRNTNESDEKTELWLALNYQYVPVKIRKTEKDGKVYELLVTSLKTEKPATQLE